MATTNEQIKSSNGAEDRLSSKDFTTDQDVRWCPGCGDYSILKQAQKVMPELGIPKEKIVFISGIGCSSRFPYYLNTYGMHSIHGRATAVASGLKSSRPDLSVWIVTGDGDGLSIGGNHLIHLLRRNIDVNILLFNNEIYGLTKGQYSPTSPIGTVNKATPMGSIDHPFNPIAVALGADGTFVARSMDRDPKHLVEILHRAHKHKGVSFVEIYQNCNIFNDGIFFSFTEKESKQKNTLFLEQGKPLLFGDKNELGIKLDGFKPIILNINEGGNSVNDLWVHDEYDQVKANILSRFFNNPKLNIGLPRPFGVFYVTERPSYDELMKQQIETAIIKKGEGDLDKLLSGKNTWVVQ